MILSRSYVYSCRKIMKFSYYTRKKHKSGKNMIYLAIKKILYILRDLVQHTYT